MKTITTKSFFLLAFAAAGFLLLPGRSFAQQKTEDQAKSKKTITIHVTKEVDGNTVVIDTTVVTDGDFDADAFLEEKGVLDDLPEIENNVEKHIIIRHPGSQEFSWNDSDNKAPDTIIINEDKSLLFDDKFDMPFPPNSGMPFNFNMPETLPHFDSKQIEEILEGMARSIGLENVTPFGEMKQVVVKKKHNGKKVIITFKDREGSSDEYRHGNKKEERIIIHRNSDQGMAPSNEDREIIDGKTGGKFSNSPQCKKTENGDQVIINEEVDKPVRAEKKTTVIIVKDDGTK
jgi:putative transposon-encoded protein